MSDSSTALAVPLQAPVAWRAGTPASDGAAALRALQVATSLGEKPATVSEEATGLELEVARLHQKTQLLIELLAVALQGQAARPAAQAVLLSTETCQWHNASTVPVGSVGSVALWLHPAAPEPLLWPAEIRDCQPQDAGYALQAQLLPLGEAAQAALDRQVFLLHRRAVAEAKALRS